MVKLLTAIGSTEMSKLIIVFCVALAVLTVHGVPQVGRLQETPHVLREKCIRSIEETFQTLARSYGPGSKSGSRYKYARFLTRLADEGANIDQILASINVQSDNVEKSTFFVGVPLFCDEDTTIKLREVLVRIMVAVAS